MGESTERESGAESAKHGASPHPDESLAEILSAVVFPRYPLAQRSLDRNNILPQALRHLYLENPAPHESSGPKPGESQPQRNRLLSYLNSIKVRGGVDNALLLLAVGEAKRSTAPGYPVTIEYLTEVFKDAPLLKSARDHYCPEGYGHGKREFLWDVFAIFQEFYQGELGKDIFDTEYMGGIAAKNCLSDPWTVFSVMEGKVISRAEILMRLPVFSQENLSGKAPIPLLLKHPRVAPHGDMIMECYGELLKSPQLHDIAKAIAAHAPRGISLGQLLSFALLMEEYNVEWALASFDWGAPLGEREFMEQLELNNHGDKEKP